VSVIGHGVLGFFQVRGRHRPIQGILGHSTTAVTEKYAHLKPDAMKDAMKKAFAS
jgi:site-specific recombinase XerD